MKTKEELDLYLKSWHKNHPWYTHYNLARARCKLNGKYANIGSSKKNE